MGLEKLSKRKTIRNALRAAVAAASIAGVPGDVQAQSKKPDTAGVSYTKSERNKPRLEIRVAPERLDEAIKDIETKLAPGGLFARAFENPATSREEVDTILRYINRTIEHLEVLQNFSDMYGDQKEALERKVPPREYFRGTTSVKFNKYTEGGIIKPSYCGGYYMAMNGGSFFVTAKHCVEGTLEENQFFAPGYDVADIAVRYEPEYRGPALTLDPSISDKDIQGRMVVLQGKRVDTPFRRVSFLIRMSPALYKKIFNESPETGNWMSSQFASTFMMPLQPGDATINDDRSLPAQGMSGAVVAPWIRGGYRASGPFFGTVHWSSVPGAQQVGLSSAMGFVQGIDVIKKACNQARALHSAPGWVTRIKDKR